MDEQKIKNLIKVLSEIGARETRETDVFSKFFFFWICFNAWLDYRSNEEIENDSDRAMLIWLKSAKARKSDLRTTYEQLKLKNWFRQSLQILVDQPPVYDPRKPKELINIQNVDDFDNIVEAIYQIRCNLFHGKKEAQEGRGEKLARIACEILSQWIGSLRSSWDERKGTGACTQAVGIEVKK